MKYKAMIPEKFKARFVFTGLQNDVESIINILNIGVLSTYTEGISNAILEYMALAKPTVASIGGGTVETVVDEQTGFLIQPRSPEILAKKLNHLLDNPEQAKKMGIAGRKRLENIFGLKKMTTAYYKLYQNVCKM